MHAHSIRGMHLIEVLSSCLSGYLRIMICAEFNEFTYPLRTAEIVIKLRNRGEDAYKHDIYGDSIIIERKLSQDGSGSYKLKSSKCKLTVPLSSSGDWL